ncbi:MAG: heme o synthase [Planctomycetota bacterium]
MSAPAPNPAAAARLDAAGLAALLRPRIAFLVLVEAAAGYLLEAPADFGPLPGLLLGTLLVAGAGCTLNHYLERDIDARMERTQKRPLVTGALSERQVLGFGIAALLAGLLVLALCCGTLVVLLMAGASAVYLGLYTPLKRRTSANTWVGALPGALPLLAGSAAAGGPSRLGLLVFALIFLWQLPHFFAIAAMYREDYQGGGLRMLSGDDPDNALLRWSLPMMVMSVVLLSALPVLLGPADTLYLAIALLVGGVFLASAFAFRRAPGRPAARRVVLASVAYLPLVLSALVVDVACVRRAEDAAVAAALPVHGRLPDFQLTDHDGRPFGRAEMLGSPWVVDFIFTSCSGPCVPMTRRMIELHAEGLPARFLSVSVDPGRDDPAALASFRERSGGGSAPWTLLTGQQEQILALAKDAFRLPVAIGAPGVDGLPELFHSERFALVDAEGAVRGYYAHNDTLEMDRLRRDLRALRTLPAPTPAPAPAPKGQAQAGGGP